MIKGRVHQIRMSTLWLIGLAGLLFFWIQPLSGKILLPLIGGAPSMWLVSLFFFQFLLLAAYSYVYFLGRHLESKKQLSVHKIVLGCSVVALIGVFYLDLEQVSLQSPERWLFVRLLWSVGLPLFVLAATSPFLQALHYSSTKQDPYYLYAVSNFACILALVLFIVLLEPLLGHFDQRLLWCGGYLIYALLTWKLLSNDRVEMLAIDKGEAARPLDSAKWVGLSFLLNSLLYGITFYLTDEILTLPLLWVIPLLIFLMSFVVAFSFLGRYLRWLRFPALFFGGYSLAIMTLRLQDILAVGFHFIAYILLTFVLAERLAQTKPNYNALRQYYVGIALGGIVAGIFHLILAPVLFQDGTEYGVILILAVLVACLRWWSRVVWAGLMATSIYLATLFFQQAPNQEILAQERNFFGVKRVVQWSQPQAKVLMHGSTIHGAEEKKERIFSTYYQDLKPLFELISQQQQQPLDVIVAGLGTGNMACFARPQDNFGFIEIDEGVTRIAKTWFGFLDRCPPANGIMHTDARLGMKGFPPHALDMIIVDVYHSDSIPAHLMTQEAFMLYLQKLRAQEGYILFHISNRFFDLKPIFHRLAKCFNLHASFIHRDVPISDIIALRYSPEWVLLSRGPDIHQKLKEKDQHWQSLDEVKQGPLWTDQYSSIIHPLIAHIRKQF